MTRIPIGLRLTAAFVALSGASALHQVYEGLRYGNQPVTLVLFQALVTALSVGGAVGAWRATPWAGRTIVAWGAANAAMLAFLPSMIELPVAARPGLIAAAFACIVLGLALGRYVHNAAARRGSATAMRT